MYHLIALSLENKLL